MFESRCPHCGVKLGNYHYADACPHCQQGLENNTRPLSLLPVAQSKAARTWPGRLFFKVMRVVES